MPPYRIAALVLLCAVQAHAAPLDRIGGSVRVAEPGTLPADATLTLELLDVSGQDAKTERLARLALPTHGRQPPLAFELPFHPADVNPDHRYAIRATLISDGELLFAAVKYVPVLTHGAGKDAQLVLQRSQPTPRAVLENTYWKLVEINGRPAQVLPGEREAHILLLSGRASGSSGCNKLMGGYALAGPGVLRIGPLASTRMACPPDMMAQETALLDAFERATAYRIEGEALALLQGDAVLARFASRYFK
jgi:putative lipoprotein